MKPQTHCRHTSQIIESLLSATDPAIAWAQHQQHLEQCPICRSAFEQLTSDLAAWQATAAPIAPLKAVKPALNTQTKPSRLTTFIAKSIAAAAAAMLIGFVLGQAMSREPQNSEQDFARDYALLITNDNSFPIEFFNE